jgi:SAM-dependent methyltransferase
MMRSSGALKRFGAGGRPKLARESLHWDEIAGEDPFWAVLAFPGKKYGRWDAEQFFETGEREIAEVMTHANGLSRPRQRERALDFGCGLGRLTRPLSQRFQRAIGLDISETMIQRARELNRDFRDCEFRATSSPDLKEFPDQSFDFVYCRCVLQHLPAHSDIGRYIGEFLRVVRDDGLVAFQLPHELPIRARIGPRRKLYLLLRGLGASTRFLYWRLGLHPNRITSMPTSEVCEFLARGGGRILDVQRRADPQISYLRESVYFAARTVESAHSSRSDL